MNCAELVAALRAGHPRSESSGRCRQCLTMECLPGQAADRLEAAWDNASNFGAAAVHAALDGAHE